MATPEGTKRKQTLSILEKLRLDGMPNGDSKYQDEWSGKDLPLDEESAQDAFEGDVKRRSEQSIVNRMGLPAGLVKGANALGADIPESGPTGMRSPRFTDPFLPPEEDAARLEKQKSEQDAIPGNENITPYSEEYRKKRQQFSKKKK